MPSKGLELRRPSYSHTGLPTKPRQLVDWNFVDTWFIGKWTIKLIGIGKIFIFSTKITLSHYWSNIFQILANGKRKCVCSLMQNISKNGTSWKQLMVERVSTLIKGPQSSFKQLTWLVAATIRHIHTANLRDIYFRYKEMSRVNLRNCFCRRAQYYFENWDSTTFFSKSSTLPAAFSRLYSLSTSFL